MPLGFKGKIQNFLCILWRSSLPIPARPLSQPFQNSSTHALSTSRSREGAFSSSRHGHHALTFPHQTSTTVIVPETLARFMLLLRHPNPWPSAAATQTPTLTSRAQRRPAEIPTGNRILPFPGGLSIRSPTCKLHSPCLRTSFGGNLTEAMCSLAGGVRV